MLLKLIKHFLCQATRWTPYNYEPIQTHTNTLKLMLSVILRQNLQGELWKIWIIWLKNLGMNS